MKKHFSISLLESNKSAFGTSSDAKPIHKSSVLQKKAVRIITYSHFQFHASSILKKLILLKLTDIVKLNTILFMHQYYNERLPKES